MAASKPTILFVPGAWHKAACYTPVIAALENQGYPTSTANLASVGPVPGLPNWDADIAAITCALEPLAEGGKSIVVATHSYGSLPANEALVPFLRSTRAAQGKKGGVVHVVYISAFVLSAGTSLMDALGGQNLPWFDVAPSGTEVYPLNPGEVFYNDLPPAEQDVHIKALLPFSYRMFFQKSSQEPWKSVQCSFVFCTQDKAIPMQVQRGMVDGTGVKFRETLVEAGHSPFLSKVDEVVGAIVGAAGSGEVEV